MALKLKINEIEMQIRKSANYRYINMLCELIDNQLNHVCSLLKHANFRQLLYKP